MSRIFIVIIFFALSSVGLSQAQTLPSIWRIEYNIGFLHQTVILEFCENGLVNDLHLEISPSCDTHEWFRFGNELWIHSLIGDMYADINESEPNSPYLDNIEFTGSNNILLLYPNNTQPSAYIYPVSPAQLEAYKQVAGCPIVPPCSLTGWGNLSATEEPQTEKRYQVSPNPTEGQITLLQDDKAITELSVDVLDAFGSLVLRFQAKTGEKLDVSALTAGIYFVKVKSGNDINMLKILKH